MNKSTKGIYPNDTNVLAIKHTDAIFSKMIHNDSNGKLNNINTSNLSNFGMIPMHTMSRIETNDDILQLFPDMEIAIKIMSSSILAPQDMITTNLNYNLNRDILPPVIRDTILTNIKEYIEVEYKLTDNLPTILKEAIFTKGAYAIAIIPEAAIDEVVNSDTYSKLSTEDRFEKLVENKEYLYSKNEYEKHHLSIETYDGDKPRIDTIEITDHMKTISNEVIITDNPSVLTVPKRDDNISDKILDMELSTYGLSNEDYQNVKEIFRKPQYGTSMLQININDEDSTHRKSVGKPLIYHIPTEAIIPIHSNGDPSNHLGYYVVLDESGAPLSISSQIEAYKDINMGSQYNAHNTDNDNSTIINSIKTSLQGITQKAPILQNIEDVYSGTLQSMLEAKIKNGTLGDKATLEQANDIYRVMFFRALKQLKTRVLFLPAQLVTYYAYEYRDNGTGKSLLEKVSILSSIRSIMLFSRLMASVKNSINTTKYEIDLDDDDADPNNTRMRIISEALKNRVAMLPLGLHRMDDMSTWSQTAGMQFHFNHKSLPDIKIDQSNESPNKVLPDTELADDITEQIFMTFGMNREIVNGGFNAEFAATIVQNNILFRKRVAEYQQQTNVKLSKHARCILTSDGNVSEIIKKVISGKLTDIKKYYKDKQIDGIDFDNIKNEEVLTKVLSLLIAKEIEVSLPTPEVEDENKLKTAFDNYKTLLDDYLPLIINEESLNEDIIGSYFENIEQLHNVIKTILYKDWMSRTGLLPEVSKFLTLNEENEPLYDILGDFKSHNENLVKVFTRFMKDNKKVFKQAEKEQEKLDEEDNSNDDTDNTNDSGDLGGGEETPIDNTENTEEDTTSNQEEESNSDNVEEPTFENHKEVIVIPPYRRRSNRE